MIGLRVFDVDYRHQRRLLNDSLGTAPHAADLVEVELSNFTVKAPYELRRLLASP